MNMIEWIGGCPVVLDQTKLPLREETIRIESVEDMARAIERLSVRGAPLIGVSAAFGLALAARLNANERDFLAAMRRDAQRLSSTRPTAVNLFWALSRVMEALERAYESGGAQEAFACALGLALKMKEEDIAANRALGMNGQALLEDKDGVLTHCNAGALATAGYGTALGVVRAAIEAGKKIHVYADETRPLLQGARLTAWELKKDLIPVTLLTDGMVASLMREGAVNKVIVGADRIAKNGDTANKIGTYGVAILARAHAIPFYVAAPESTIDRTIESGRDIPIEARDPDEVRRFALVQVAPAGVEAYNPAFDVTPGHLIDAIITEQKVYTRDNSFSYRL